LKWNFKYTPDLKYIKKTIRKFLVFKLFEKYYHYYYFEKIYNKEEVCPICEVSFRYMRISRKDHVHKNCGVTLSYTCLDTGFSFVYFATPWYHLDKNRIGVDFY